MGRNFRYLFVNYSSSFLAVAAIIITTIIIMFTEEVDPFSNARAILCIDVSGKKGLDQRKIPITKQKPNTQNDLKLLTAAASPVVLSSFTPASLCFSKSLTICSASVT